MISTKDLLKDVKENKDKPLAEIYAWAAHWMEVYEENLKSENPFRENIRDSVTEEGILKISFEIISDIWRVSEDVRNGIEVEEKSLVDEIITELLDVLETWVNSNDKKYSKQLIWLIAEQFDDSGIDEESEATQQLFKKCLDQLCDEKVPWAIRTRGYCYYCGTSIYPNNWIAARDAFIEYYELTGDGFAANTLGYIFYYGRCNDGVPEYDKAFYYFSIGHAHTIYESTYKLGDMFANGYGVRKDEETANQLYWSVYKSCLDRLEQGEEAAKFADAALRMGDCFRKGIGAAQDAETAYYYYLQADYGIRKRMDAMDYYGDDVVFKNIQEALAESRKEYTEHGKSEKYVGPGWTRTLLAGHRSCHLIVKELKNGALSLTAEKVPWRDEHGIPQILLTIPRADYCELLDEIKIKTAPGSEYRFFYGENDIVFDHVEYRSSDGRTFFYMCGECVGEIKTRWYSVKG